MAVVCSVEELFCVTEDAAESFELVVSVTTVVSGVPGSLLELASTVEGEASSVTP